MARINAKLGFVTVIEKEEEENLDVNEAMMEDTINVVSKFETEYLTTARQLHYALSFYGFKMILDRRNHFEYQSFRTGPI